MLRRIAAGLAACLVAGSPLTVAPPPAAAQTLQDENLLTGLPSGFRVASRGRVESMSGSEYVPQGETVENWTRMITVQIFHNVHNVSPDTFADGMRTRWTGACMGASVEKLKGGLDHGYPYGLWRFLCPLNPQTGKPENTFMKFVQGKDAFYGVQYAFRSELTPDKTSTATAYLDQAMVCDTRDPTKPCPDLKPAPPGAAPGL
jgi:hypothetical protein